jgi:hypothetical protein
MILVVSIVAGVLVLGGLLLLWFLAGGWSGKAKQPIATAPEAPASRTHFVSKTKVDAGDFGTIAEALANAESGDRIVVRDTEIYEESLVVTSSAGVSKRDLSLEAEADPAGRTATLLASGTEPIIVLDGAEAFHLKGFTLDGQNLCDDLIKLAGPCANTVLERLRLEGFKKAGIRLENCQGSKGKEVRFTDLRIEARREKNQLPVGSLIGFGTPGKSHQGTNRWLRFERCRFEGPCEASIRFDSSAGNVLFERNLFLAGKQTAILLPKETTSGLPFSVQFLNNTFWDYESGLLLQQFPSFNSSLRLSNSLFYQVKPGILRVEGAASGKVEGIVVGAGNVFDQAGSAPGNVTDLTTCTLRGESFTLPTRNRDADDFLRFPQTSPLANGGEKEDPVGALPPLE